MNREEFNEQSLIDRIENRINAEYRKHKDLNWAKIAAIKIAHEVLSFYGSPLPPAEGAEHLQKQIKQLKEFHTAFNLPQRQVQTIMPSPEFFLRHKILMEEVEELREAYNEGDIVEVADAITDCLYVLFGTALQFGIADKLEACFDEVHRSNMSKLGNDGKPIMREDGKVMKGENFKRPDLERVLNEPVAAQPQPTAEGAEEILARRWTEAYPNQPFGYGGSAFKSQHSKWVIDAMTEFVALHAQRIADKMVSERLRDAPKNCPKAAQCSHVEGGMKCPPNVICPI